MTHTLLHLDEVERIHAGGAGWWRPIRRALGVTAFGVNAYTADDAADPLIERDPRRDELRRRTARGAVPRAVRTRGLTVAGRDLDAPAGSLLLVEAGSEARSRAGHHGAETPPASRAKGVP